MISLNSFSREFILDFKMAWREPSFVLPTLSFPILFYVFFGILFSDLGGGENSATYLMVSYGVFGIMAPALFGFGATVAAERDKGWLALKQISPMPASQYILAKLFNALLFSLIVILILFSIGAVFGNVVLATSQWLLLAGVMLLGSLPFCALGLAVGFWVKGNSATAILNLIFLPSAFLSGLAIPVFMFPAWLQQFALLLPPFHLSQLGLKIVDMDLGHAVGLHITALIAATALFSILAITGYKRSLSQ